MINFYDSESLIKPDGIDTTSSQSGVYIRILVKENTDKDGNKKYNYKEAFLDKKEWEQYIATQEALGNSVTAPNIEYSYKMNIPILYKTTGFYYKPIWAENIYLDKIGKGNILPSIFPMDIYDVTNKKENAVSMTMSDLSALTEFLSVYQKQYFKEKKEAETNV
jgi:hypothetical protein